MLTIANRIADRSNNFGLIRFIAASLVVFSHSYPLTGHIDDEPLARVWKFADLAGLAVISFFVISGFLVARSAFLSPTLSQFVRARLLRIWPALMLTAVFTALFLGPVATILTWRQYFSSGDTWLYAVGIPSLDVGRFLPGTFLTNPLPRGVNGSLWTIQIEVWLYVVMGCAALLRLTRRAAAFNAFIAIALTGYVLFPTQVLEWIPRHDAQMMPWLVVSFILGALIYFNAKHIPLSLVLGAAMVVVTCFAASTPLFGIFFYSTFAYSVILIALHPALYVARWNQRADYSYGIYLFAFPIQQTLVSVIGPSDPRLLFAISYPGIVLAAAASWSLVESKALAFKATGR